MAATRFIFEREFPNTADRMVPLETKEPIITVSEHQRIVKMAEAGARNSGFAAGRQAEAAEQTARLADAMEQVARMLDQLRLELDGIQAMASDEALCFARDFGFKLAGKLLDEVPMAGIEAAARSIFDDLRGQPHVAVRVAPDLTDAAKEKLTSIARERGFEGRLIVLGEPEIPPGDVRIEWADGGIVLDRAMVERTVAAGVERALATRTQHSKVTAGVS
jgi:flagellar assembly protein FliH